MRFFGRSASKPPRRPPTGAARRSLWVLLSCVAATTLVAPLTARQIDVYVVFGGGDRDVRDELLEALPDGLSVRSYNSNLLALADYSGKQKVLSKLETARVVVILSESALEHLQGRLVGTDLVIVRSVSTALTSDGHTLHVLTSGTDVSALGRSLNTLAVGALADLADEARVRTADVVFIDEGAIGLGRGVALVIQRIIGT